MRKTSKKGFTIVELVIVIAIIAILAAILIPTFANVISDANDAAAVSGARGAYTEYQAATLAENGDGASAADDFIYKHDGSRFVVFKDGEAITKENSTDIKIFTSLNAALALFNVADNPATTEEDETETYKAVNLVTYETEDEAGNPKTVTIKKLYLVELDVAPVAP